MNQKVLIHQLIRIFHHSCPFKSATHHHCHGLNSRLFHTGSNSVIFEVGNGVGGSEATLFAEDMLRLYMRYFAHKQWPYQILEESKTDIGGILFAKLLVTGAGTFQGLVQEAGVHRVQRVPKTEKYGRMHTSTVTVSVLPKSILDIKVDDRDLEFQTKRSSGPGGQHVNKTESAVRIIHKPTGITVECQESRFQLENRKIGMKKLIDKMRETELAKITSKTADLRRSQVGHADRNEKIRTYNFPKDRVTDHRLGKSYHNLKAMFYNDISTLVQIINDYNS